MARGKSGSSNGVASFIFGLLNPVRDPSLLVAIILTVIEEGGSGDPAAKWAIFGLLNWIAVKAVIWLLVNFAFSFVYLARKAMWVARHPRLAWRLLDAMGTEEIIIGGLRPDMFATEDGTLHPGQYAFAGAGYGVGALAAPPPEPADYYADRGAAGYGGPSGDYRYDDFGSSGQDEQLQEFMVTYSRLISDWLAYTEEKWRAVSDSQLGWKPLRGRWHGWEEIYRDAFAAESLAQGSSDPMTRRFENAFQKGSAASAVACFMHDVDSLRQHLQAFERGGGRSGVRTAGLQPPQTMSQRTSKSAIIRNPRIVDAD